MKCFYFSNGEDEDSVGGGAAASSRGGSTSRVSWARSLSLMDTRSSSRSHFDSESTEFSDTVDFHHFLAQRRANDLRLFSFSDLKSATRAFSRALLVGEGGFGSVYRGFLDQNDVAIKQLNRNGHQGHKEWINEVNLLGVMKHPNLVKLVGYCAEDDERGIQRLLVYEFMPNKSLEDHLLARVPSTIIPWGTRLRIAQDAARGLAYLHEEMDFQLIFRDFKTSNILLDENFNAKLSDFGLARQGPSEGSGYVSTAHRVVVDALADELGGAAVIGDDGGGEILPLRTLRCIWSAALRALWRDTNSIKKVTLRLRHTPLETQNPF
ncbi:Serine/threonine-protein kinase PCRK1 isoform C [Glycine soja]|uniref:non-specific serine/threonine protein kinase n=1 Tax=Glycine soja TaxID=3848 RepID=A0A445I1A8_GLYSO|nr:Serine/threonine-protein kinase PCRK1 isoform C [Glycine soja]